MPTTEGDVPVRPSFPIQLSYEFNIRKKAFELVREDGHSLAKALRMAREDSETRSLRFITPLGVPARRQPDHISLWRDEPPTKYHKGDKGKGKGKGKDKKYTSKGNKGFKGGDGLMSEWNGKQICYKFNNGVACGANCARIHVCQMRSCNGAKHPTKTCEKYLERFGGKGKR